MSTTATRTTMQPATADTDPIRERLAEAAGGDVALLRSYDIARERDLLGTARLVASDADAQIDVYAVPSGSVAGEYHVRVLHRGKRIACLCRAAQYGNPACGHRGATAFALLTAAIARATAESERAEAAARAKRQAALDFADYCREADETSGIY